MGVAQKTLFSILDRLAKFFGKSWAPMEHNTTAKSKQAFLEIRPFWHKRPRTILLMKRSIMFIYPHLVYLGTPEKTISDFSLFDEDIG